MAKDDKKLARQVDQATLEDTPLGMLPDGKLNVIRKDDPPFEPKIVEDGDSDGETQV